MVFPDSLRQDLASGMGAIRPHRVPCPGIDEIHYEICDAGTKRGLPLGLRAPRVDRAANACTCAPTLPDRRL